MNYNLRNLADYNRLTIGKLKTLLEKYPYFRNWAEKGDIVALCLALDIEDALKNSGLTKEECICIVEYFIIGGTSYIEVGRKIGKSEGTVRKARIPKGLEKILYYLKTGDKIEL
ncbi:hypothetical protein [Tepidimicrobium xylanilyticum]